MLNSTALTIVASVGNTQETPSVSPVRSIPSKRQRILSVPGLTGPVLLVGSARVRSAPKGTFWRDILSLVVDILDLRAWSDADPVAGFMLAAYIAAVAQPLVYGALGNSIVALMTPVK
jgi:hypothetical protein